MKDEKHTDPVQEVELTRAMEADAAMLAAESLFDADQICAYYTIVAFLELFSMVQPKDRKRLAQILEGLVVK